MAASIKLWLKNAVEYLPDPINRLYHEYYLELPLTKVKYKATVMEGISGNSFPTLHLQFEQPPDFCGHFVILRRES